MNGGFGGAPLSATARSLRAKRNSNLPTLHVAAIGA